MSVFTLEVLQTVEGDCLLLHSGSPGDRQLILVDGGPSGTYRASLAPRLAGLRGAVGDGGPVPLALVMVSHIDDDHVIGVLDLLNDIINAEEGGRRPPATVDVLWHNAFETLVPPGVGAPDSSIPNLASIVALAECGGRRMLLTGDARGDNVLAALSAASLSFSLQDRLDVLKVPYHGSDRNVDLDFFRALPADHYVISANGRHHNPSVATLQMISAARPDDDFTLHFTNRRMHRRGGRRLPRGRGPRGPALRIRVPRRRPALADRRPARRPRTTMTRRAP